MMKQQGCEMVQSSVIVLSYASTILKEFRKINNNSNNNQVVQIEREVTANRPDIIIKTKKKRKRAN